MSMAPFGPWWFITVLLSFFSVGNAKTFVSVECKAENVGQYGNRTMLECVVHFTVKDANIMIVTWKKDEVDKPVLVYKDTAAGLVKEPGYQFAEESWNSSNMNVSLLITKTKITHTGTYTCTVITDRGLSKGSTNLRVTAKYNTPTIQKTGENAMECHSDGGHPKGELRWIVDGTPWQQIIETDGESEGGLWNLSSKLTLTKDSPFSQFTCQVYNAKGEKESEATFDIPKNDGLGSEQPQSSAKIVAPLLVIGSIIVGLLFALLFLRRRARRDLQGCRCEHDAEQGADLEMVDKCEEKPCLKE